MELQIQWLYLIYLSQGCLGTRKLFLLLLDRHREAQSRSTEFLQGDQGPWEDTSYIYQDTENSSRVKGPYNYIRKDKINELLLL